MSVVKVSIVSYLNTLPMLYGLENSPALQNQVLFSKDVPSVCATKLREHQVDMGIVPVAVIPSLSEYYLVSDFCIGAVKEVASVLLVSEVPLHEIQSVYLDYQSLTSINLVQVLAKHFWKINPQWIESFVGYEKNIGGTRAGVVIGDRTFHADIQQYTYKYDLSLEWYKFTNLPFVFACWITTNRLVAENQVFIKQFNEALKFGTENINKTIPYFFPNENPPLSPEKLSYYWENNISYSFDSQKKKGLSLFLNYLK